MSKLAFDSETPPPVLLNTASRCATNVPPVTVIPPAEHNSIVSCSSVTVPLDADEIPARLAAEHASCVW